LDHRAKFDNFQTWRAFEPIVTPADNDVAPVRWMAVISKVPVFEFELDSNALPLASIHLTLRLAIRESGLNRFDMVSKLTGDHSEEEHDTLLVDWLMAQPSKVDWVAVTVSVS
jgi:hypothetical protein